MFANTGIYFVVAGVQYWCPNYMTKVLDIDVSVATTYFAITSFSAPVSGVLIGGVVTSYYGGFNNKNTQALVLIVGWVTVLFTIPIPLVS